MSPHLERVPLVAAQSAARRAFEDGQDRFAGEIGYLVKDLRESGATDDVIVEAVLDVVVGRIEAGLPQDEWFVEE